MGEQLPALPRGVNSVCDLKRDTERCGDGEADTEADMDGPVDLARVVDTLGYSDTASAERTCAATRANSAVVSGCGSSHRVGTADEDSPSEGMGCM